MWECHNALSTKAKQHVIQIVCCQSLPETKQCLATHVFFFNESQHWSNYVLNKRSFHINASIFFSVTTTQILSFVSFFFFLKHLADHLPFTISSYRPTAWVVLHVNKKWVGVTGIVSRCWSNRLTYSTRCKDFFLCNQRIDSVLYQHDAFFSQLMMLCAQRWHSRIIMT